MYSIKQAAKLTGLPESTLRYYEKMGLIDGITRDKENGYRVYTNENIETISSISCLSATGMSISDMKKYILGAKFRQLSFQELRDILMKQKKALDEEMKNIKFRKKYIDGKINFWLLVEKNDAAGISVLLEELEPIAKKIKSIK